MANEFIARKGLIVSGSTTITGSAIVNGSVTASFFSGDGSQLTNISGQNTTVTVDAYYFTSSGAQTEFLLDAAYNINSLFVVVDGLSFNAAADYIISSSTVVFTSAPPSESIIAITALVNVTENATGSFSGSFFGTISTASFALTASYVHPSGLPSGVVSASSQVNTGSFTGSFNGTTAFTQLPNISIVADNHFFIADGATVNYTLSQSYNSAILTVSVDGMVNALTEDYTVSGTQLSFLVAPPSASNVLIKSIRLSLT
jgi:hypothetical protein